MLWVERYRDLLGYQPQTLSRQLHPPSKAHEDQSRCELQSVMRSILQAVVSSCQGTRGCAFTITPSLKMQCKYPSPYHMSRPTQALGPTLQVFKLVLRKHILLAAVPGHVTDARALHRANHVFWENALDLGRVNAWDVALETLVSGHPAP
jgi:hypothetical protein